MTLSDKFKLFLEHKPDKVILTDLLSLKTYRLMNFISHHVFEKIGLKNVKWYFCTRHFWVIFEL